MRGFVLAFAGAASAILAASPAAAQYYGQRYGYNGYGYNGYGGGYADPSGLEQRIYNVLRSLDGVRPDQRGQVRAQALNLERQLRFASRNGLTQAEGHAFDVRIYQLERYMGAAAMNQGYGYRGYGYQGYNGYYQGQDRGRWHRGDDDDDGD